MKLIKNTKEWQQWVQDEIGRFAWDKPEQPSTYPCFAYASLESWGQETLRAEYLYRHDIDEMAVEMLATEAQNPSGPARVGE